MSQDRDVLLRRRLWTDPSWTVLIPADPAGSRRSSRSAVPNVRLMTTPPPGSPAAASPDVGTLAEAVGEGAPAVRAYPAQWGMGPGHSALSDLMLACGESGLALHITVRFEDLRQRHQMDSAGDVSAATLRALARLSGSRGQLVVAGAGRELLEETHWGLTPHEQARVWYDFGWIWGPPEDHFAHLVRTVGANRLVWASWWPLRLTQQARALVDLLPPSLRAITPDNAFADGRSIAAAASESRR